MKNKKFFINGVEYSQKNVLIVAELGTSHGGDPVKASELIDAAAEAGADCVKFQIVYAKEILHPNTGEVALPGGKIRLYDRFRELELPPSFFAEMKEKIEKKGLIFLCTPFGPQSARELKALEPKCIKIASPELNYTALIKEIAPWKLPLLLSTGVSRMGDIEDALAIINNPAGQDGEGVRASWRPEGSQPRAQGPGTALTAPDSSPQRGTRGESRDLALQPGGSSPSTQTSENSGDSIPVCLLHCVTAYPAPEKDYNLKVLGNLSSIFGVPSGISDHSLDPELVPVLGTAMGATVIEKHFCLSRDDPGLDDPIALPPALFAQMVRAVRWAQKTGPDETIAALSGEKGRELVENVLGDGIKRLAPSEMANYGRTNRSVHALRDIARGEIIEKEMIASLRTEKILRPGLPPSWEGRITGRRAKTFIPAGEGIRFDDI